MPDKVIYMIKLDDVLEVLAGYKDLQESVNRLFRFPAPNPKEVGGKNIMGQTEEEFWAMVDQ